MSFFDSKEEVINIELTQYGKELLSKGKFRPEFYSFHDDDILYDSKFGNLLDEKQNNIEKRIINETILCKPTYIFSSPSADNNLQTSLFISKQKEKLKKLVLTPLGKSSYASSYYPSYKLYTTMDIQDVKEEEIIYNPQQLRESFFKIPQIIMKENFYRIVAGKDSEKLIGCYFYGKDKEYYLKNLGEAYEFFDINEKNVDLSQENFELEVYIEEPEDQNLTNSTLYWRQLIFKERPNNNISYEIRNDILYDKNEIKQKNKNIIKIENNELSKYVDTYLDIRFDDAANSRANSIYNSCPDFAVPPNPGTGPGQDPGTGTGGGGNPPAPKPFTQDRVIEIADKDKQKYC